MPDSLRKRALVSSHKQLRSLQCLLSLSSHAFCTFLELPPLFRHTRFAMIIESKAPTRVDLAGGTLDIWPLYLFHPGAVTVNAAISRYASCVIETNGYRGIRLV